MRLSDIKDPVRESRLFRARAIAAGLFAVVLMVALGARLTYLQVFEHEHYTTLSRNNRVDIVPIAPTRGLIYDRNGVVLAENLPSFSLEIVPEQVTDMDATLKAITKLIDVSKDDLERFHRDLRRKRRFEEVPLRFHLSDEEVARIAVNRYRLPGVEIKSRLTRHYPLGPLTAHVVGYVGRINEQELRQLDASNYSATSHIGKVGVEKSYEPLLHGQVGFQQVETNARGRILRVLERQPPVPGRDLYLNVDVNLQRVAEEAFGGERGALVALDPNNGSVLALVSMPSYDPNLFVDGINAKDYHRLSTSRDRPLFNRALRGQYPPGSTVKPFVGLAGLELGDINAIDKTFCPGWFKLKGDDHRYRGWKKRGHGWVDVHRAIVESCDVFFYSLAQTLGIDRLSSYMKLFGFGHTTGIDLRGEAAGLMPSREWKRRARHQPWFPGETLIAGIGQGFVLATPLQLAANVGALSMRGERMQPRLLKAWRDPLSGKLTREKAKPLTPVPVAKPSHWDQIISAMEQVVHSPHGTARRIGWGLKYHAGGKTGTAQVFGIEQGEEYVEEEVAKRLRDHALFVTFAPVENPQIAVAVIVENGGSGGAVAAPIARKVMDAYLLGPQGRLAQMEKDHAG
jgi:penicillin-binding protein 2